ncbi:MAG TPA: hypothetical protein VLC46_15955 [Thermoanaerobaculia bacterium]|nr:hypothetical protein [Thermoanaerobaculia bacterium]
MNHRLLRGLVAVAFACFLVAGCSKAPEASAPAASSTAANPPAPAASASTAASPANSTATSGTDAAAAAAKAAAVDFALKEDAIKNDPDGQWAIQAKASSSYQDAEGAAAWSANQATGAPNVERYGDDGKAWTSKTADGGIEWLELTFPKAVFATEVRIRESCGSGAVIKVEIFDDKGAPHAVWSGNDPTKELNYFPVKFDKTTFKTDRVKITLATNVVPGWNEIDAVQLVGKEN